MVADEISKGLLWGEEVEMRGYGDLIVNERIGESFLRVLDTDLAELMWEMLC